MEVTWYKCGTRTPQYNGIIFLHFMVTMMAVLLLLHIFPFADFCYRFLWLFVVCLFFLHLCFLCPRLWVYLSISEWYTVGVSKKLIYNVTYEQDCVVPEGFSAVMFTLAIVLWVSVVYECVYECYRLAFGLVFAGVVYVTPLFRLADGTFPFHYYGLIMAIYLIHQVLHTVSPLK